MISKEIKHKVCVFGFSYKKNTSDTRLSQSAYLIDFLSKKFEVSVHDPKVTAESFYFEMEAQGFLEDKENSNKISFCGIDYLSAAQGADAIVVMTEWDEFKKYDYSQLR
jgi:UDPglucose 6-dehydrogenase